MTKDRPVALPMCIDCGTRYVPSRGYHGYYCPGCHASYS